MWGFFFHPGTVFCSHSILCPHPCWKTNCLNVHFKGFSIIKGSISLRWKLHCWFKHLAASSSPSERFSDDDICSNHWVTSITDIKNPTSRCINSQRRRGQRRETDFLDWLCHGGEENIWHFLLCSPSFKALQDTMRTVWLLCTSD